MNKRVKVCLALFLALAVIAQYSFSPQVMIAYGEDGEVTAASEESSGDSGQTAEKKEAEKPAPAPEQKATEAPAPAPAASSDSSDSSDTPEPAESAAPAEENDSAEADETSAADDVDVGEEEPAVDEEEALEEEEEEGFPAQDFSGEANGVSVKVSAPKGALPEGTKMSVKGVSADQVQAAVEGLVDGEVANLKAVDISFKCDGKEIEPKKAVSVHMTASGVEADKVVHIADSGNANVVGASTSGNSASFKSADFSIYVVVEDGETGDDARLNVVFVKANGDEVKMPITKRQIADINTYIYDPGVGDISGKFFKGWAEENEDYTAETPSNTISDIRTTVTNKLNAGVEEGDTLYYYAMVFDSYKVTYRDQNGVTLKTDENLYRSDEEDHTYTISLTYEPYSEESEEEGSDTMASQFMGWEQISPAVSEETIYQPNDEITLTGDIILKAKVSKGYWLVFNENKKGSSYVEPLFVPGGQNPTKPEDPTCTGYEFLGWYTDAAGTTAFNFNAPLDGNTVVYGKWKENQTAPYSIIIWKQKVTGDGYDFERAITGTGNVNTTINAVTQNGSNVNTGTTPAQTRNVTITGAGEIAITGFHCSKFDSNVSIKADGTSVLNVYYDRNVITIHFNANQSGASHDYYIYNANTESYSHEVTYQGLYEAPLEFDWPTTKYYNSNGTNPSSTLWYYSSGYNNTVLSLIGSYKLPDNDAVRIDLYLSNAGSQTVSFFQMDQNGNYSDTPKDSANMNNLENFSFSEKYTGFQLDTYRYRDGNSWSQWRTAVEDAKPQVGRWDDVDELQIRYKRVQKPITFMDGKYLKSDGTAADETNRGELKQTAPMYYGADTTSYNKGNSNYYAPEFEGYAFMGWYADETCTKPYSFDTMDADGITVYALWKGVKYHIVLHPNGSEEDPVSFADPTQALEFNVDNGEAIGAVGAERLNYDLVGWYTDESFKHAFDFDSFKVNGTIVKKYGTIYDNPDPANLIGELNLYANWRSKLEGDKGIDIVYTEGKYGDATKLPVDNESYTDKAQASAGPAIDSTDEDWVFSHWVVQKYEDGAFADTSVTVYPGDTFDVHVEDAKVEGEGEDTTYTIQLRAEFVKAGKATPTHIDFYYNYEGKDDPYVTLPNIEINSDVELPNPPGREGYNFVGWIKDEEGNPPKTTTDKTTLLITYDGSAYDHNVIAADELDPYEALYASWECKPYTVSYEYGNTAPGAPDLPKTVNYNAGESVTVAAEPTLEGYTFSGWSIKSPSGVVISGGKFNMPESNVVLTGTWTKNTHNVTYEFTGSVTPEGVQPPTDSTDYSAGAEVTVKDAPTAVGYTFSGWVAPEGVTITDGKFTMPDKDVTLTGSWSINKHKVTYVYDGDVPSSVTPPAEKTDVEYGSTVDAAPTPEAVAGYTFKGWDKPDSFSMPDKDVTITGTWEETPKVKVTFTAKSATKTYDGTPLTESGVTVKGLPSGYTYEAKTIGTITNSGTAPNTVESFVIYDADGKDVTTTFDVTLNDGTLKVNKRNVTITSGDATKVYDGTALTNSKIDISGDGFVEGQEPMITVTGSQTEVGSSKNTFTWSFANVSGASANAVLNALASNDVAANYVIHPVYGTLTVTAAPTPTPTPTPTPNNPGGGTAAAAAPAAAPQVIADEPTPTTIVDEPAPKAAPAYWALINLLCAIATALLSLIMLIRYFGKRKDEEELADPATGEMVTRDVEEQRGGLARIASLIPAIGGIIAFILTEDMSLPMAMVDKWTVLMIVILAIQAGVGIVAKLRDDKGDEDEEAMA